MQTLGLYDSLSLCWVLAQAHDPLFDQAARRWLIKLAGEDGKTLGDVDRGRSAWTLVTEPLPEKAVGRLPGGL